MNYLEAQEKGLGLEALGLPDIRQLVEGLGQPKFRSKQLIQWLFVHGVCSYAQMSNLPAKMRDTLAQVAPLHIPEVVEKQQSGDGSRKYLLRLADCQLVETVGIPSSECNAQGQPKRLTVCFSTQVGCPMACAFCATGQEGLQRNLYPGEMVQQVLCVQRDFGMKVSNVVAMGQGEPFLNYQNLMDALHIMNSPDALNIGARHITVSSCGILQGIQAFGKEPEQFTLAISLHAARQEVRNALMPKCANMPLPQLKESLQSYYRSSKRRISFEYLLIKGVNDSSEDLQALLAYCQDLHVHINLIPLNKIPNSPWQPSPKQNQQRWLKTLNEQGIESTIRNSKASDIKGACGQLKNTTKTCQKLAR